MQTSFRLNGHQVKLHCDPTERLTYALRERLKIPALKSDVMRETVALALLLLMERPAVLVS